MRKLRDEQKGLIFIAIILFILSSVVLFFTFALKTDTVEEIIQSQKLVHLLLVVEEDDGTELFSTVIIYDPETKKGASFNVPSYTGATYKSLGRTDSLEAVYNQKGMEVYKNEVENLLGIKIPFTTSIRMDNFIRLTDMLGGMRIFIFPAVDQVSPDGEERWLLPSGAVNLDGDKISTYLQYRVESEDESDILDRYQNVITAFLTQLHDKSFVIFDDDNFKQYGACLDSNLIEDDEKSLYRRLSEIDPESLITQTITGSLRTVEGKTLLLPLNNGDFVKRAVKQTTSMIQATEGNAAGHVYVLEIQNGTTVPKLASRCAKLYSSASYKVISTINADNSDYMETVILDHVGNETAAKNVGELIRCKNIRAATKEDDEKNPSTAQVDFTIILGADFNGEVVY